ncbi:MAG: cell wall-associated NlpC family hydrolase [Chitinophagales bacterium]|jgi:cell wall-associated NlpC family hydrolase
MRPILLYIFLLWFSTLSAQESLYVSNADSAIHSTAIIDSTLAIDSIIVLDEDTVYIGKFDSVINMALQFEGVNYRYGGMSENGVDCSGLVCIAYGHINIPLAHSSSIMATMGMEVEADDLQIGDLIFFKGRTNNTVSHVAIVSKIVDGFIHIVHSTTSSGVIEEILQNNSYFMKRWLFNRRII